MSQLRGWIAMLGVGLAVSSQADAKIGPAALEEFLDAVQDRRVVRMEIVHITSLILTITQLDSTMFDGMVDDEIYAKQPDADCYAALDNERRSAILSEFNKYPAKFTRNRTDINWRILMLDAKNRVWYRIYIGQVYNNTSDVLMIVDGQIMTIDRRFVDFLDKDKSLNRCHF